ncbi:MAG TPA: hypothetical protein VE288_04900 [Rubrobacteraceae bacterium]|nr:hypothetical protein [Rubrobacteraceae bacterium]
MADRSLLRLSTTLVAIGEVLFALVTLFHPDGEANNHPAVFAEYASSGSWIAIHFGQFVFMAVLLIGLFVLSFALNVRSGALEWVGRFAAVSVVVALALYGVVQAVDGVALKHAVDAWVSAPEAEKATRFASAETVRWLEWGTSSYQTFMFALALILLATVIVGTARVPRAIGYLMGLAAIPSLVQSWVLGTEGFAVSWLSGSLSVVGLPLMLAWSIWLLIVAWRMKEPDHPEKGQPERAATTT